jgi:molecular chaperone GrpE (heat shock protein)
MAGSEVAGMIKDLAKTVPAIRQAVEEVAEDNIAVLQAIRRAGEGQESLRSLVVQEIAQLRNAVARELLAQSLRTYCREISPVLNALEGVLEEADFNDAATTRQHVESIAMTLASALSRMGIEPVPVTVGSDLFDSRTHECVRVCTAADSPIPDAVSRTIVRVQEPGYAVLGKLAVPAKVWVQKLETQENPIEKESNA